VSQGDGASEAALAERASAGDSQAFSAIFDAHAQSVYRFCWRRAPEPSLGLDAEDLMSIVFLEAWKGRSGLRVVDGSVRPWLFGIANNVLRNRRRTARRHRAAMRRLPAEPDSPDVASEVVERVGASQDLRDALHALDRLGPREREAVELCWVEGIVPATAAQLLGVPLGTVKSRLSRARSRLTAIGQTGVFTEPAAWSGHEQGERTNRASTPGEVRWSR